MADCERCCPGRNDALFEVLGGYERPVRFVEADKRERGKPAVAVDLATELTWRIEDEDCARCCFRGISPADSTRVLRCLGCGSDTMVEVS